jgi:hypothetical protein
MAITAFHMRPHTARSAKNNKRNFSNRWSASEQGLTLAATTSELTWQKHVFAAIRLSIFSRHVFGPPSGQPVY